MMFLVVTNDPTRTAKEREGEGVSLPKSTHMASIEIAGVNLVLHVLDDGTRIIEQEGMDRLMALMLEGELTPLNMIDMARFVRGEQ